jgi:hypothetical protein
LANTVQALLVAQENDGYSYLHWKDATGNIINNEKDLTFAMPARHTAQTAFFQIENLC